jgi:hypothetical protein
MVEVNRVIKHWGRVFMDYRYVVLALVVAVLFYSLNVLISQWKSLITFYSGFGFIGTFKFFFILIWGFGNSLLLHSYISLIVISILIGVLFSLILYKIIIMKDKKINKKGGLFASVAIFLAALVPGCAACGIGLAAVLGISGALVTLLPFDGLELSFISVAILIIAIFKISKDSCKIMFNKKMKGGKKK